MIPSAVTKPGRAQPGPLLECRRCHLRFQYPKSCPRCGEMLVTVLIGRIPTWWEEMGLANPPPLGEMGDGHDPRLPKRKLMAKVRRLPDMAIKKSTTKKSNVVKMPKSKAEAAPAPAPEKKGKEKKEKKEKKKGPPPPSKYIGKTTNMRVQEFQDDLMKKNYKAKKTDAQLAKEMRAEFPNAVAFTEAHIAGIRSAWNGGKRPSQEGIAPDKRLEQFDAEGNVVNSRSAETRFKKKDKKDKKAETKKSAKKGKTAPPEDEEEDEEEPDDDEDLEEEEEEDEELDEEEE